MGLSIRRRLRLDVVVVHGDIGLCGHRTHYHAVRYILIISVHGHHYLWTSAGLTYLLMKHMVDRYNMIHVNVPSVVHNSVHCNAAQLMQVGLVLTQATVTVYVILRREITDVLSICCFMAFVVGLLLTFGRTVKRWIFSRSWIKYSVSMIFCLLMTFHELARAYLITVTHLLYELYWRWIVSASINE